MFTTDSLLSKHQLVLMVDYDTHTNVHACMHREVKKSSFLEFYEYYSSTARMYSVKFDGQAMVVSYTILFTLPTFLSLLILSNFNKLL